MSSDSSTSNELDFFSTRRSFLKAASLTAMGFSAMHNTAGAQGPDVMLSTEDLSGGRPVKAKTAYGKVRGLQTLDGVKTFKGIPYGADMSGRNRFKPPVKPAAWEGVKDAIDWGPRAPQLPSSLDPATSMVIGNIDLPGRRGEDCLVLNIWTKGAEDGGKRPVMVRIHGGSFVSNTGNNPKYWGRATVLRGDVVYVTVNHRLGCLGFLDLSALGGEYAQSANVGMLDLVAALEWIQENIEFFGGDPDNVMLWGESGGGEKISTLLGMRAAKGLFHKAVIESGARLKAITPDQSQLVAERFLSRLGLGYGQVEELLSMPVSRLMEAQAAVFASRLYPEESVLVGFGSVVDGDVLPTHMFDPTATPISSHVPLIIGNNKHEASLTLFRDAGLYALDEKTMRSRVKERVGVKADDLINAYRRDSPEATPTDIIIRMVTDIGRGGYDPKTTREALRLADRKYSQNPETPIYMYRFDWESPAFDGKYGAVHGAEDAFFMDTIAYESVLTHNLPEAFELAAKINSMFIEYARSGVPSAAGMPDWARYDPENQATMLFDYRSEVRKNPHGELRKIWEEI